MKRIALIVVLAIVGLSVAWHYGSILLYRNYAPENIEKSRTYFPLTNSYAETEPRQHFPNKLPHAVLFVHGWGDTPQMFSEIYPALEKANIPYYSPELLGFGLGDFHLLACVKDTDWIRDVFRAHALLSAVAEKVDVVGLSMGTYLSLILAQQVPVRRLILLSPGIVLTDSDLLCKKILQIPVLGSLIRYYLPYVKNFHVDCINPNAAKLEVNYKIEPINSVMAVMQLTDRIDLSKLQVEELSILHGKFDRTVDIPKSLERFNKETKPARIIQYDQSAHGLMFGFQTPQIAKDIVDILLAPD